MARGQAKRTQMQGEGNEMAQPVTKPQARIPARQEAREQANEVVLAMDIGTRSIIGMVGVVEEGRVKIIALEREEHTERAMIDGQIENIEKVSALAGKVKRRLEEKTGLHLTRVCVAAAGRALRTKRAEYELELSGSQQIDDEIISRLEAGAITRAEEAFDADNELAEDTRRFYLVGYTVCQYFLDQYMISNLKDHRGKQVKVDLIATFLPSEVVESLYTTMNKIGLEVASLTLEPIAAINAAIPENIRLLNLVLVDIGAGTSDIAACTGGSVTGYTMATVAGDEVTETIMKQYLVDFSTAEGIKARLDAEEEITFKDILGADYRVSRDEIFQCIQGTSGFLCKEIADKVMEINGSAPSALFLAGGGSKLAGLKEGLTAALGMAPGRVAIAGNYFNANAFSDEYDLNNPEYATPLGIAVSSGLNMINDSFRVTLNNKPAKLFRSGSFTALNLLMMNGYNFRDLLGRTGQNLVVTVNGARKVFYGSASEPATLLINQKEGKISDIIHAGDSIDFMPAVPGISAAACLGDIEGAADCLDIRLNGIHAPLKTPLKSGDVIHMTLPKREAQEARAEEAPKAPAGSGEEAAKTRTEAGTEEIRPEEAGTGEGRLEKAGTEEGWPEKAVAGEGRSEKAVAGESRSEKAGTGGAADWEDGKEPGRPVGTEQSPAATDAGDPQPETQGMTEPQSAADAGEAVREPEVEPGLGLAQEAGARAKEPEGKSRDMGHAQDADEKSQNPWNAQDADGKSQELRHAQGADASPSAQVPVTGGGLEPAAPREEGRRDFGSALTRLGRFGARVTSAMDAQGGQDQPQAARETAPVQEDASRREAPAPMKNTLVFRLNGSPIELPKKADDRPYYLMDMIQHSGIDLEHPRGVVKLTVNGAPGMFQQVLNEGDVICIEEERR